METYCGVTSYRVSQKISQGGFGQIYVAKSRLADSCPREVALKVQKRETTISTPLDGGQDHVEVSYLKLGCQTRSLKSVFAIQKFNLQLCNHNRNALKLFFIIHLIILFIYRT